MALVPCERGVDGDLGVVVSRGVDEACDGLLEGVSLCYLAVDVLFERGELGLSVVHERGADAV